ncbi:MAG: HYR domain-containing protein [Nitrospinota bacterium]
MNAIRSIRLSIFALIILFASTAVSFAGGVWTPKSPVPINMAQHFAVHVDGYIYAGQGAGHSTNGFMYRYNIASDAWEFLNHHSDTYGRACGAKNGKIYCFGGVQHGGPLSISEIYDPSNNSWSNLPSMPTARTSVRGAFVGNKFYAIGGSCVHCRPNSGIAANEAYDISTNSWSTHAPIPTPRTGGYAVESVGGKIYVMGGLRYNPSTTQLDTVEIYDPQTNAWVTGTPLPKPLVSHVSAVVNGKIIIAGGGNFQGVSYNTYEYDPVADEWSEKTPIPVFHGEGAAAVADGRVHVIGGQQVGGYTRSVHSFDPNATECFREDGEGYADGQEIPGWTDKLLNKPHTTVAATSNPLAIHSGQRGVRVNGDFESEKNFPIACKGNIRIELNWFPTTQSKNHIFRFRGPGDESQPIYDQIALAKTRNGLIQMRGFNRDESYHLPQLGTKMLHVVIEANTETGRFDGWVDGQHLFKNFSMFSPDRANLGLSSIDTNSGWAGGGADSFFDDLVVTTSSLEEKIVAHSNHGIVLMNTDGTDLEQLTSGIDAYPIISPDGTKIVFNRVKNGIHEIWVLDLQTGIETQITQSTNDVWPSWSPDGNSLTYIRLSGANQHQVMVIQVYPSIGNPRPITPKGPYSFASWGADNETVFFTKGVTSSAGIYKVDINTSIETPVLSGGSDFKPKTSDDGKNLAITSFREGFPTENIYIADLADPQGTLCKVTSFGHVNYPSWSTNGDKIVFSANAPPFRLYITDSKCNSSHQVLADYISQNISLFNPDWGRVIKDRVGQAADTEPPVITAPADITVNTDAGQATAVVNFADATATDNSGSAIVTQTGGPASGSAFPIGVTTVTWQAEDASGNTATASMTVTVVDNEAPVLSVPASFPACSVGFDTYQIVTFPDATATDNSGLVIVAQTGGLASGSQFPMGANVITWTATDPSGNTATGSFTVTVIDCSPPSFTQPPGITVNTDPGLATAVVNFPTPIASDNDSVTAITQTAGPASGSAFPLGSTTVTFQATDPTGNIGTVSFNITVVDNEDPVITVSADISADTDAGLATAVVNYTAPTATDNVPGVTVTQIAGLSSGATYPLGTTTNTFRATDAAGNTADASFTVTVVDNEIPVVTAPSNVSFEATGPQTTVAIGTATASDNVGVVTITSDAPATFPVGSTTVTWTAADAAGNTGTATQTVTITDTTAPVITAPAKVTEEATGPQTPVAIGQATATDAVGPVTITNDAPASYPVGTTTVTWTATDAYNNSSTATQLVTVEDTTAPIITLLGDALVTLEAGDTYTDDGARASDIVDGDLTASIAAGGLPINNVVPGSYTITYNVSDAAGNAAAQVTRTVTVVDTTPSVVTPPADILNKEATANLTPVDLGVGTATDIVDGSITPTASPTGPFAVGTHTVTWSATDNAGNTGTATQTVIVKDTTDPVLTVPSDVTVDATGDLTMVDIGQATATDLVTANVTIENDAPASFPIGTTIVTWTATDEAGNEATATQTIIVLSPAEIIDGLGDDIADLNLPKGPQNSLKSKLNSADKALSDSNPKNDKAGINTLNALINSIKAQSGKKISVEDANDLIDRIQNLIELY